MQSLLDIMLIPLHKSDKYSPKRHFWMGFDMTEEISLMVIKKRAGLSGEHCDTPFMILNLSDNMPFTLTRISLFCKKFITKLCKYPVTPTFSIMYTIRFFHGRCYFDFNKQEILTKFIKIKAFFMNIPKTNYAPLHTQTTHVAKQPYAPFHSN